MPKANALEALKAVNTHWVRLILLCLSSFNLNHSFWHHWSCICAEFTGFFFLSLHFFVSKNEQYCLWDLAFLRKKQPVLVCWHSSLIWHHIWESMLETFRETFDLSIESRWRTVSEFLKCSWCSLAFRILTASSQPYINVSMLILYSYVN